MNGTLSKSIKNRLEPNLFRKQPLSEQVMGELRGLVEVKAIASNTRALASFSGFSLKEGIGLEGDLVLCRAKSDKGAYSEVEDWDGKMVKISKGDLIVGVLSNRESSRFLVGHVPESGMRIEKGVELDLLARGGNIGICDFSPKQLGLPLRLEALALMQKGNKNVNVADDAIRSERNVFEVPIIVVVGTSAECGKTTASTRLIEALTVKHGDRVATTKLTGTGRLGDILRMYDAGGIPAIDFVDAGLPSTYTSDKKVVDSAKRIISFIEERRPNLTIAEFGGDIIWGGVPAVLGERKVRDSVVAALVCSDNATAVYGSVRYLRDKLKYDVPAFVSGPISDSAIGRKRLEVTGLESFNALNEEELVSLTNKVHRLIRK